MTLPRPLAVLAAVLALAACSDKLEPIRTPSLDPLTVETSSDRDTLVTGDTALITFRFTNPSDTTMELTSKTIDLKSGKPCPVLIPVAAYAVSTTSFSFILSTCYGGADTTLTGQLGVQNLEIPARGSIERTVPFTGFTRDTTTSTPRCLPTGKVWVLPLFLVDNQYILPNGTDDVDGPSLLYLKPPAAGTAPCTTSGS